MKKQFFFLFFLFCSTLTFAQSSLDSLRLVLPIGHTKSIKFVCLSYDNNLLATIGDDNSIIIWEFLSSKQIQQILIPETISKVYFINNNQNLVIIGISKVFIYSLKKGILEKIIDSNGAISSSQMSYDQKYVIIGMDNGSLKIVNFKTTEKIYVFKDIDGKEYVCEKQQKGTAGVNQNIKGSKLKFATNTKKVYLKHVLRVYLGILQKLKLELQISMKLLNNVKKLKTLL